MKKVIIIGNSAAGFAAAKALRESSCDFEITVISKSNYPCYKKDLLIDYFAGSAKDNDIFLASDKFYQDNSIKLIKGMEVVRIDGRRQGVVLKDKNKISYDFLIIASGEKVRLPDIPGKTKEGVVTLNSLEDIKIITDKLLIATTVCVVGSGDLSMRLARALADKSKEVKVIGNNNNVEPLQDKIELINNAEVQEIIGESKEVQALKLNSGKAIGTDLVLFVGNYTPESDFLKDVGFQLENGYIITDENFCCLGKTNIFACGSIARKVGAVVSQKNWDEAANEGVLAGQNIINILKEQESSVCQKF